MLKQMTIASVLMTTVVIPCSATRTETKQNENITIGTLGPDEGNDLAHTTCMLSRSGKTDDGNVEYLEGAHCPLGAKECDYYAVMKLNGVETRLKQVMSSEHSAIYSNGDITLNTQQTRIHPETADDEGSDYKFVMVIKMKDFEKRVEMEGYCGV
ncbi:adhesin [Pseudocitrobacter sp. 73]|uniref:adhesin n=1 Tax=Pseudocitrobacter sp. 73 TaxID=2605731 RepID=UPI0011ED058C|nr:adhesin [Pseudocitrobacter sp. 73]KAA1049945.1 adhesin [Pseudocitrobacter sp. 73]